MKKKTIFIEQLSVKFKNSSFTILTIFACLSVIGFSLIPLISVQLTPSRDLPSLDVDFRWHDASARVIEQEVTSKLEGMFNVVKGVQEISSNSDKGKGSISIEFKKNTEMDAVRFEIANLIRQSYSELPEGVSYPQLSSSIINENKSPIVSFSVNANESPYYINKYTKNNIVPKFAAIKGVNQVDVYGAAPFEWVVEYSTKKLLQLNISVNEIQLAINQYIEKQELGNGTVISKNDGSSHEISLVLGHKLEDEFLWEKIPIKKIGSRIIYLENIATVRFQESPIKAYFRINGLNTVNLVIYSEKGVNNIETAKKIKEVASTVRNEIAGGYSLKLTQDTTEYIVEEIQKIEIRTLYSLLILLVLIVLIYRSFKYLMVLFLSILTNLLIAVIFYYLLKVELQLYSFAGITISFGIIIDNSIIMMDHLRNKGDKKAFLAILAATLTTIGALMVIFMLEASQRVNLWDFVLVIAINIGVSLLVSLYYVPALLVKMNLFHKRKLFSRKRKRRVSNFTKKYTTLIFWLRKPRYKWILLIVFILGFGLPLHLLPKNIEGKSFIASIYNKTIGNEWFNNDIRPSLEKVIGGSLRLFTEDVFENSYYSEPERTTLRVSGRMPDGCTIEQLNEVIQKMENFIGSFDEVDLFETRVTSYRNSNISIYFKKEFEFGSFPFALKSMLESKAISLGGLDWTVSGVGRGFSNALGSDYKNNRILLKGYNYEKLYHYAEILKEQLLENSMSRIKAVDITSGGWNNNVLYEYYLDFNLEQLALADISQSDIYSYLKNQVHSERLNPIVKDSELQQVKLISDDYGKFNVWDLKNMPIDIKDNQYKLNQVATIEKKKTGNTIKKINQQYQLTVAFNFIGIAPLAKRVKERNIKELKAILPIGYEILEPTYKRWDKNDEKQYYYIFIVILIIFFICSILLESLKQPFVIISMIPISFIGVFLTFYLFDFNFDQGGYASFILLGGISVNSALYIINDFKNLKIQYPNRSIQSLYFKAFNYKIIPVILTIVSTIAGLIPFVWAGQNEAFWFSFAVGSIGGLLFSMLAILIYLPVFNVTE